jgi:ribosomal protein S6E (S10)
MDEIELLFSDPHFAARFYQLIDKRIDQKINGLKFDKSYSATVMAVGTGAADIKLQNGSNTITGVKNKTGVTLAVNDEVVVEAINGSLNNLVIKYKK